MGPLTNVARKAGLPRLSMVRIEVMLTSGPACVRSANLRRRSPEVGNGNDAGKPVTISWVAEKWTVSGPGGLSHGPYIGMPSRGRRGFPVLAVMSLSMG